VCDLCRGHAFNFAITNFVLIIRTGLKLKMASKTKKLRLINPVEALRALHDNYFGSDKEDVIAEGSVAERVHQVKKGRDWPRFPGQNVYGWTAAFLGTRELWFEIYGFVPRDIV
jgi:hypothetical protein